jgi:CheY-like chemotaxis protein
MSRPAILVVDDESNVAEALWQSLRIHEYEVQHCTSGEDALQFISQQHFDLIISDLRMPGIDGLELLERVGKISPKTRKVLITAYDSSDVRADLKEIVDAYLPKPFRLGHFITLVQEQIGAIPRTREEEANESVKKPRQTYSRLLHKIGARRVEEALLQTLPSEPSITDQNDKEDDLFKSLEGLTQKLQQELRASIIFVADVLGQIIAEVGYADSEDLAELVPLISATFASVFELGHMLDGDEEAPCLWHREGQTFDIYTVNIGQHFFLVALMDKEHSSMRTGMVWLAIKRAVQEIHQQIDLVELANSTNNHVDTTLASAIVDDIDRLFEFEK